jgi:phosphoglycerol transferase
VHRQSELQPNTSTTDGHAAAVVRVKYHALVRSWASIAIAQGLVIAASLYVFLDGWRRDIRVPLSFSIDSLFYLMQAKSTIDNGWWWFNPLVGAPFGLDQLAFPANGNVDQAIVWIVSLPIGNAITAVNLAWIAMVVLSGLTAAWCLRALHVTTASSFVAGTLFAVSPYALYKNLGHFGMATYLVPFVCTAALQLVSGRLPERGYLKGAGLVLTVGCALLSFNYVYYPFFGSFFICVAGLVGFLTHREWRIVRAAILLVTVLAGCTLVNLGPSLYSWHVHGQPIVMLEKTPAQAETFALKIRTLVSPVLPHAFPLFRKWTEAEVRAQFPLETENTWSRLGLVGTVGFLGLLGLLMIPAAANRVPARGTVVGASQLTIAGVLLATVGGFGSLFSLLVSSDIRAYSRICPFLAFFALVAIAIAMDSVFRTRNTRLAASMVVLGLGLADQRGAAYQMNMEYTGNAAELSTLTTFVRQLEERLPDRAMVLQLPFRLYMDEWATPRMPPFEHFKLYLVSTKLRWSYPAFSNQQLRWQVAAAALDPKQLPNQLAHEGFSAIVIDRNGYEDNGAAITANILATVSDGGVIGQTERYIAFDIRALASALDAAAPRLPTELALATSGMRACGAEPLMALDQIGSFKGVVGPGLIRVDRSHGLRVGGWTVDQARESPAAGVDIALDDVPFPSIYGWDRVDVANHFKRPSYRNSGFIAEIPRDRLQSGKHKLAIRVAASNRDCYYESAQIRFIVD